MRKILHDFSQSFKRIVFLSSQKYYIDLRFVLFQGLDLLGMSLKTCKDDINKLIIFYLFSVETWLKQLTIFKMHTDKR